MPKQPLAVSLRTAAVLFAVIVAHAASSAAPMVSRAYTGSLGDNRTVNLSLTFNGDHAFGSYFVLPNSVAKVTDIDLDGTLKGRHLSVGEYGPDSDWNKPDAKIIGDFTKSPLANPSVRFSGVRKAPKDTSDSRVTFQTQELGLDSGTVIRDVKLTRKRTKPHYEIEIVYPRFAGGKRYAKLNTAIAHMMNAQLRDFIKLEGEINTDVPPGDKRGPDYLDMGYEIVEVSPSLVSIRFDQGTYTGGAHPNSGAFTINWDLQRNRDLRVGDLFTSGSGALHNIALATIKALAADPDSDYDMITAGASSKPANYGTWNLTRWGWLVTFDPYQVGPYAAGFQRVYFPLSALPLRADIKALLPGASGTRSGGR